MEAGNRVVLCGQVHPDSRPGSEDGVLLSLWLPLQGELVLWLPTASAAHDPAVDCSSACFIWVVHFSS